MSVVLAEIDSQPELWRRAADCGEDWLRMCATPFWGRSGRARPALVEPALRVTELRVPTVAGIAPKSVFQIGGCGSVGTGSIRGMPLLLELRRAGASIWPFDVPGWPRVVEIYPRLLTGPVRKSSGQARAAYLERRYPDLEAEHRGSAIGSEDAFDAAVSALVMVEHWSDLSTLPEETDECLRLEGRIWYPGWRAEVP